MIQPSHSRQGDINQIVNWLSNAGVRGASRVEHRVAEILCEPHHAADLVYYIQEGQVRVHHIGRDNTERFSAILGPGDWVGMAGLAARPIYCCRARVFAKSIVWHIPATALHDALAKTPKIAACVVTQLAERLLESFEAASRLVFHGTDRRLVQTLIDFSSSAAAVTDDDGVVLQMTHNELAQAVGAARETVSLVLMDLRERNLIRTARNWLAFNPQVLKRFAELQGSGGTPIQP